MVTGDGSCKTAATSPRCEFFHPTVLVRCSKLQVTDTLEVRLVKGTPLALPVESGHGGKAGWGSFPFVTFYRVVNLPLTRCQTC